ncbi:MAG: CoA transferase [Alphaproteobacteria bacterium]|nr:CoA transferase [Alphaproteobacteria bacterium]
MPPLAGIKVLDLTRVLAGPWAAMTLGDLGAEIWKIEHPVTGDDTRTWRPPEIGGESTYYLCTNRNKRSIALDMKAPDGIAILRGLAQRADVLIENMRLGTLERIGLGWEALHALNPRLIYCSVSGYGRDSPRAADPGYDAVIQAESGLMSITGTPEGDPLKHGVAITDIATGMNATQAILAALFARERDGKGQFIDIALLDSGLAMLVNLGSGWLNGGHVPRRLGNQHPTVVPYGIFHGSDTGFVLGCGNDRQFALLCRDVIGRPELADDERFRRNQDRQRNRATLVPILSEIFATRPAEAWVAALVKADVPAGTVRGLPEALGAPEVLARGMVQHIPHPTAGEVAVVASPLRLRGTPPVTPTNPPLLGEHTRSVLGGVLGLDDPTLNDLAARGVIAMRAASGGVADPPA